MSRIVSAGSIVQSQVDYYSPPGSISRAAGINLTTVSAVAFVNNSQLTTWSLVDGTSVPDINVSSGYIYFNEIVGSSTYYSVRFFPDRIGFWRVILTNLSLNSEQILEYDVVPAGTFQPGISTSGLNASFLK